MFASAQYSTFTKYNPLAGAVAPAAERLRAWRILSRLRPQDVPLPDQQEGPHQICEPCGAESRFPGRYKRILLRRASMSKQKCATPWRLRDPSIPVLDPPPQRKSNHVLLRRIPQPPPSSFHSADRDNATHSEPERRTDVPAIHSVAIRLRPGRLARVKLGGRFRHLQHAN